ncbi:MAG: sulfur carrier protein ThiS [Verrucomicrobiae bacterium]|nr:sulfur carrier protein ThiS [Verrucomicrobiae bacterium]
MVTITANGKKFSVDESATIAQFLRGLGWKPTQVVVEYNGRVLLRDEFDQTKLQEGDRLEIVVPVAGG